MCVLNAGSFLNIHCVLFLQVTYAGAGNIKVIISCRSHVAFFEKLMVITKYNTVTESHICVAKLIVMDYQ